MKKRTNKRITCTLLRFLTVGLLCFHSLSLWAQADKKITIDLHDVPIATALEKIQESARMHCVYDEENVSSSRKVTLSYQQASLRTVMNDFCRQTSLDYEFRKDLILIFKGKRPSASSFQMVGKVIDEQREVLTGATIRIKGTTIGVITDVDGNYQIKVYPGDVLVVTFVGKETQEIAVSAKKTTVNIQMFPSTTDLGDVVVTGYQTISKERSAGSFSVIKGEDIRETAGFKENILESLEGQVAGLVVNNSSVNSSAKYLIRGKTSLTSNTTPLYVVNGVPLSIEQIENIVNSNDIESVTVLKDATAASIWGAQAANGVIVITTKSGKRGSKMRISYEGTYSYKGKPKYGYLDYMNSGEFIQTAKEIFAPENYTWELVNAGNTGISNPYPVLFPHELPLYQQYRGEISSEECESQLAALASQNWYSQYRDAFMSNSYQTNHTLSFTGGGQKNTYHVSLGYKNRLGIFKEKTDNYLANVRNDFYLTDWLKLDLTLNAAINHSKNHSVTESANKIPYAQLWDKDGNELSLTNYRMLASAHQEVESVSGIDLSYFPIQDTSNSTLETNSMNLRFNVGTTVRLLPVLKYEGRFQYYRSNSTDENFVNGDVYSVRLDRVQATGMDGVQHLPVTGGNFTQTHSFNNEWMLRNQLSFDKNWSEQHQLTVMAGTEIRSNKYGSAAKYMRGYDKQTMQTVTYDQYLLSVEGLSNPLLKQNLYNSLNKFKVDSYVQSETEYRYFSLYGNAAYTFQQKYSLNASIRIDQSNMFATSSNIRYKPIWSAGVAWDLSKESFMKAASFIDLLKLRFSYGYGGNAPRPGSGGIFDIISARPSDPYYSDLGQGYKITTPGNISLRWEKTRTINFGVNFAFLNHRLTGSIDVYHKKTTDLLAWATSDFTTGWSTIYGNVAGLTNKGVEFSLNSGNVRTKDFSWDTSVRLAYNKNNVDDYYKTPSSGIIGAASTPYVEGYPANAVFALKWAGLSPETGAARVYNKDGKIVSSVKDDLTADDLVYCGTTIAPWALSMTNMFTYKQFELSFMLIGNLGGKMRNDVMSFQTGRPESNLHKDFLNRWKKPGDELVTDVPSYFAYGTPEYADRVSADGLGLYRYADINVLNASYIKLRNLALGYTLPSCWSSKLSVEYIKVRMQIDNLFCIKANHEGIDPEAFNWSEGSRTNLYNPSFSFGLSINF